MYRSGWISVNGVPTCVRTWGGWIEDNFENSKVLVFISGNPGVTDFYVQFLSALYRLLSGTTVWVISHAGHQIPRNDSNLKLPSIKSNPELYNLEGQIKHKKDFINKYLPPGKTLYLIGHSVGAKICAELMKDKNISSTASQIHLVCPTLEHIGDTPYGQLFQRFLGRLITVCVLLSSIFCWLPYVVRYYIFKIMLAVMRFDCSAPNSLIHGFVKLVQPKPVRAAISLGSDEMMNIKELDHEVYEQHGKKMTAYFAQQDGWAPLNLLDNLKKCHPIVQSVVFDRKIGHAFVNTSPVEVAMVLSQRINNK